jgi:peptide/nickel transport system permease protein
MTEAPARRGSWRTARRVLLRNPAGLASALFILLLLAIALLGPTLFPGDPLELGDQSFARPGGEHLLGTDDLGRDVLIQLVHGVRVSLFVGCVAALATTLVGTVVGAVAGYVGGWVDGVTMRIAEFFQVMPSFILAVVIVALAGPGLSHVVAVIALLSWPQTARVARGEVLRVSRLDFVDGLRCLGVPEWRILLAEVVPNAVGPVIALGTLIVGNAILLEASLSFLGLSSPDLVSWGRILSVGQRFLFQAWWLSVFPGLAIFLTVLAFNLLGDALGDVLNPRRATQ